ncbi:MAG: hypothetical protein R2878_09740 [Thermoleophilia bacterium]
MQATSIGDAEAALERARSDYLAVSRGAHLFSSESAHLDAEAAAWEKLQAARRELEGVQTGGDAQ